MKKGLTLSMIFVANSANYSEGFGNISTLKKLHRGDGYAYTYISRQAMRYSLVENLSWNNTPTSIDQKVVQFSPEATIESYPEIDFFGYMRTEKKKGASTRSAVCRMSHAIALEPYKSDLDFLTNMGLANREEKFDNAIAQSEIHQSLYAYTITIDLDRVGIDGDIHLSKEEKTKRVTELLRGIKLLNRDIKGRRENMSPIFAIGGIYDVKSPHFEGRLKMKQGALEIDLIQGTLDLDDTIKNNTKIGYVGGIFNNDEGVKGLNTVGIGDLFSSLEKEVEAYYEAY